MTYHTLSFPPALQAWVDARIAEGRYADVADYLRDLVRRDREYAAEDRRWLKAMIDEGLASGIVDAEPEDVIDAILAEDPDLRD
ncbi:type II toxin-antitoxin system ParD family antitoxin [Sphingomonas canadensis]|uniref:Type II toxin-antitoxin system ParD family antitoxin n=1 Tax=Sphingomonas canadensis TaxID=1219257 RepID=A0ABW3H825_9SPHN|nr:type II toxin-antitoxin system ParD family antitoxin [Sphingomonas canadensis]MCW3837495.1 type II toxin-antitoxin system ParD family antitoxin [Sphingomonas canadensis]